MNHWATLSVATPTVIQHHYFIRNYNSSKQIDYYLVKEHGLHTSEAGCSDNTGIILPTIYEKLTQLQPLVHDIATVYARE